MDDEQNLIKLLFCLEGMCQQIRIQLDEYKIQKETVDVRCTFCHETKKLGQCVKYFDKYFCLSDTFTNHSHCYDNYSRFE